MTYAIREVFWTLQGEGVHAGTPAVFVRFAGCNVWSGREQDRAGAISRGVCAAWCDTEFRVAGGLGRLSVEGVVAEVVRPALDWGLEAPGIVVCTGGEPSLQLNAPLVEALRWHGFAVHVETNGSRALPEVDWITLSPKPPMPVVLTRADELKCVWPDVDPEPFQELVPKGRTFLQPRDDGDPERVRATADYVLNNPGLRLSIQTHKIIGLP